jgi:hypothetical protein
LLFLQAVLLSSIEDVDDLTVEAVFAAVNILLPTDDRAIIICESRIYSFYPYITYPDRSQCSRTDTIDLHLQNGRFTPKRPVHIHERH